MTGDVERAARVTVDPDLLDLAFHIYASPIVEDDESATHSGIAAAAFARLSGRPPAVWSDEDRALVEAVELRLGAFARLIEAGEGARLGGGSDAAWRRAVAAAVASAELIEVDGAPALRIEDVVARIRQRRIQ